MSPAAKKAVAAAAEKGSRYPFARVEVLRKAVAQYMGGKTDNIFLTHGSAEAIRASIESFDVLPSLKAEDSWIKRRMPTFVGLTPALLDGRSSRPLLLCQQCEALPQEYCGPHSRHGHAPHHSAGMSTDVYSDLSCLQI